jgi:hypothetical protein
MGLGVGRGVGLGAGVELAAGAADAAGAPTVVGGAAAASVLAEMSARTDAGSPGWPPIAGADGFSRST